DIEKAKAESAAKQEARKKAAEDRKKAAEAKQKQRQDAINSFKDSFK
ncbi:TPA: protein TolA, partial [Candidatus Avigastranaerophilus faecigallinarum]|nr:protein TolA [Candidatus Avigastranaerophilus faecigallinarum]